jgi:hypothetical protein
MSLGPGDVWAVVKVGGLRRVGYLRRFGLVRMVDIHKSNLLSPSQTPTFFTYLFPKAEPGFRARLHDRE